MCARTEMRLSQILLNILGNAVKFTPEGGSIEIDLYEETSPKGEEYIRSILYIKDTGIGMSEEFQKIIFEAFAREDNARVEKAVGAGMGMTITKYIVDAMEGNIEIQSEPGKGTRFRIMLPAPMLADGETPDELRHASADVVSPEILDIVTAAPQPESEVDDDAAGSGDEPSGDKPILLVIDDNADLRALIASMMAPDYTVIAAPDGRRGLRMAARYVPDLIICDVMMPVMDGMECCRRIKSEVTTSHIPVLMLTACTMDEQRIEGYDNGADGYLSKPFSSAVLLSRCASLIANRKRIKELWHANKLAGETVSSQPVRVPSKDIDMNFTTAFWKSLRPRWAMPT